MCIRQDTAADDGAVFLSGIPDILTLEEAARILRISRNTAYQEVRCGRLKSFRAGRQIRIAKTELLSFMVGGT